MTMWKESKGPRRPHWQYFWLDQDIRKRRSGTSQVTALTTTYCSIDRAIRPAYQWDVSCQRTALEAVVAFLESTDVESAISAPAILLVAMTLGTIAGGIAQASYRHVPRAIVEPVRERLPRRVRCDRSVRAAVSPEDLSGSAPADAGHYALIHEKPSRFFARDLRGKRHLRLAPRYARP